MKIINNVPNDLEGGSGEKIKVEITATGTVFAVSHDLDGVSGVFTNPLTFVLGPAATVSVLVLFFTFSAKSGGAYEVKVSGLPGTDVSHYKVVQFPNQPSNAIAYAINIV